MEIFTKLSKERVQVISAYSEALLMLLNQQNTLTVAMNSVDKDYTGSHRIEVPRVLGKTRLLTWAKVSRTLREVGLPHIQATLKPLTQGVYLLLPTKKKNTERSYFDPAEPPEDGVTTVLVLDLAELDPTDTRLPSSGYLVLRAAHNKYVDGTGRSPCYQLLHTNESPRDGASAEAFTLEVRRELQLPTPGHPCLDGIVGGDAHDAYIDALDRLAELAGYEDFQHHRVFGYPERWQGDDRDPIVFEDDSNGSPYQLLLQLDTVFGELDFGWAGYSDGRLFAFIRPENLARSDFAAVRFITEGT